jgi:hypothetical protein
MAWMALRAAITTRVAVKVRGISRITSCGVLSSFISLIRRSSVVLNTAMAPVLKDLPAKQKAARSGGGCLDLLLQFFRLSVILPPPASCRS